MLNLLQYSEIKPIDMNKKLVIIGSGFILNTAMLLAQYSWIPELLSYDQAVLLAIQNNPGLKIKNLDYLISTEQLNEARLQMVPQIYGRYDIQHNLIIPSTLVPVGIFNPALPADELLPVKFGTNWSSGLGLVASVKLFDPQTLGDIREKRASISLSDVERKITKVELETETGKAYANCLLSLEQLKFAADDTINSYGQLEESQSRYSSGMLKQTDLNQAVLNHRSAVSRYNEAHKIWLDSRKTLFYWMGSGEEENKNILLTDSLDLLIKRFESSENKNKDLRSSFTYERLEAMNDIDNIKLKNLKAGFLPSISLNGVLASDYYNQHLHLGNKDYWFGNSNINLSLRIPVTEGINRTKKIVQQKYQIEVNREELNAAMNEKELEIKRVSDNIDFYRKEISSKNSNLGLARANYNAAFSLFKEGRILPSEMTEAEISFKQVKIEYLQAMYHYINALLDLKRIIKS